MELIIRHILDHFSLALVEAEVKEDILVLVEVISADIAADVFVFI